MSDYSISAKCGYSHFAPFNGQGALKDAYAAMKNDENKTTAEFGSFQPAEIKNTVPALPAKVRNSANTSAKCSMMQINDSCKECLIKILSLLRAAIPTVS
jgi:hypothetical protein